MKASLRRKKRNQILNMAPGPHEVVPTMFGISARDMSREEMLSLIQEMQRTIDNLRRNLDNRLY